MHVRSMIAGWLEYCRCSRKSGRRLAIIICLPEIPAFFRPIPAHRTVARKLLNYLAISYSIAIACNYPVLLIIAINHGAQDESASPGLQPA
jgi:hypothetical protein